MPDSIRRRLNEAKRTTTNSIRLLPVSPYHFNILHDKMKQSATTTPHGAMTILRKNKIV